MREFRLPRKSYRNRGDGGRPRGRLRNKYCREVREGMTRREWVGVMDREKVVGTLCVSNLNDIRKCVECIINLKINLAQEPSNGITFYKNSINSAPLITKTR